MTADNDSREARRARPPIQQGSVPQHPPVVPGKMLIQVIITECMANTDCIAKSMQTSQYILRLLSEFDGSFIMISHVAYTSSKSSGMSSDLEPFRVLKVEDERVPMNAMDEVPNNCEEASQTCDGFALQRHDPPQISRIRRC